MVDAGFADTVTARLTCHLYLESLTDYQNLREKTGLQQKAAILSNSDNSGEGVSINFPTSKKQKLDDDQGSISVVNSAEVPSSISKIFDGALQEIRLVHGNTINVTFNLETKK